ncbi:hypothetical protein GCM10027277_29730 [Pseudoduganella ginsengisoli]|uniref:DUF4214 domain-containing protein n=1 Tax=Pseudoduganella ginsengisoli TaxID=1462440 RepID=A0A6L6PZK1_9BURK|nr:DUF4214 domain-containing protein [Pseudoduganella ginsengisoli]MTW03073.1 DUF4214 domain-containing protein [Pseudoduganella ginsengisoli]
MANTAPLIATGLPNVYVTDPVPGERGIECAVALADGKLLATGPFGIFRFGADGKPDPTFGGDGKVTLFTSLAGGTITALAVTADGKYLVAGHEGGLAVADPGTYLPEQYRGLDPHMFIRRYNADGSLDATFGAGGKVVADAGGIEAVKAMRVQPDGKIVLAGTMAAIDAKATSGAGSERHVILARFDSTGVPDRQFGKDGVVIAPDKMSVATDMEILPNGGLLVAAQSWNGKLPAALAGQAIEPWPNAPALLHFHADGSADTQFGTGGLQILEYPANLNQTDGLTQSRRFGPSLTLQQDGKYLVALDSEAPYAGHDIDVKYFAVARFLPDGALDQGFGTKGWATPVVRVPAAMTAGEESLGALGPVSAAVDSAGRIIVGAQLVYVRQGDHTVVTRLALQRLQADGQADAHFGEQGQVTLQQLEPLQQINLGTLLPASDGGVTLVGTVMDTAGKTAAAPMFAKYLADGTPDLTWQPPQPANRIDYVQGRPDAVLNAGIAVYDRELMQLAEGRGNYQGAYLVLQREGGAVADDMFGATGALSFQQGHVLMHGIDIGAVHTGGGMLRIDFNGAATGALVNDALAAIAYQNVTASTASAIRLGWTFSDGALAATAVTTVALQPNATPYWVDSLLYRTAGKTAEQMAANERALLGPDHTIKYSFATDAAHGTYTASERAFVEAQMQKIAGIVNVHYVAGRSGGSDGLELYNFIRDGESKIAGQGSYPNDGGTKLWMAFTDFRQGDAAANAVRWSAILQHELGHTLGLKHPFDAGPGGVLPRLEDNMDNSLMSYTSKVNALLDPPDLGRLDIAALQYLYGPNPAARAGDDTYVLTKAAFDVNQPDVHNFIWDGNGVDTISGAALADDITLYLEPGRWGYIGQRGHLITDAGQITVNYGTVIENAVGGSGNDTLSGNGADNVLQGGAGNDVLAGLQGNDRLDGGAGTDTAVYGGARSAYTVLRGADGVHVSGAEGNDVLTGIERVAFADGMLALDIDGNAGAIYRLYRAALGRTPDQEGLGYWIKMLDQGMSMADAARCFTSASEFTSLYGGSHDAYLQALYRNVLQREPDAAGLAWWTGQMDHHGASEADVLLGFCNSAEFQAQVIGSTTGGIAYQLYAG